MEDEILDPLLKFESLRSAEKTLRDLDERFQRFKAENDPASMERCRQIILKGKKRALMISTNTKVSAKKREEKAEIAQWFTLWLQTPDVFWQWLSIRQATEDYCRRFGGESPKASLTD